MPRRKTFEEVKAVFEGRGYKLISSSYKNAYQKLNYICPKGHEGSITYSDFQQGHRCNVCAGNKKKTIEEVKDAFEARGYKLLTSFYVNNRQKLKYVCPEGHMDFITYAVFSRGQGCSICGCNNAIKKRRIPFKVVVETFEARGYKVTSLEKDYKNGRSKISYVCLEGHVGNITFDKFKQGHGCPVCAGNKKKTIEEVREVFEARGYTLVTSSYTNNTQKLEYICPEGHRGSITYAHFFGGQSCPSCGRKRAAKKLRTSFKIVVETFEARGYKVTSSEEYYKNNKSKVFYICPKGHVGSISVSHFISGQGCSKCAHEKLAEAQRLSYNEVKEYFESYNYVLVSTEYLGSQYKLDYICPKGHKGSMTLDNFKRGERCHRCMANVSNAELSLRDYVISLVGEDLVEANIKSIIHPLELDIYIPSKKLAIEYCGLYWHSELSGGKAHDYHRNKMDLCLEKGIRLITIFEDEFINQPEVVKSRIKNALGCIDNRIYARKTMVKRIDNKTAYKFLEENHLQGKGRASVSFGLFYEDRLLQVLTVGHLSRAHASFVDGKKVRMLELKRFASVGDAVVIGGASKLFKQVKKYAVDAGFNYIKSYSDNRYANPFNSVYEKLGFSCISETRFTPHYVYGENRYRNQALRKTKEERLTGKTEWQLRQEQGYDRIWDCGHKTFLLEL